MARWSEPFDPESSSPRLCAPPRLRVKSAARGAVTSAIDLPRATALRLFPEARLVLLFRQLELPHPREGALAGVPPQDGVVVPGLTQLLGFRE
jgi:hypothetical protein